MIHYLLEEYAESVPTYPKDAMFLQDWNALFHTIYDLESTQEVFVFKFCTK